ncbi:MAG: YciI family protein [Gammaproteobacteria bacterium]
MPRFMMIVKASKDSEAGVMPEDSMLAAMGQYNEELIKAGVMLDGAGLQASSKGWRVQYSGGKRTVVDGPFAETKELIAGYWIIRTRTREEALAWSKRIPNPHNEDCHVEVRQFFELEDFAQTPGLEKHKELQARLQSHN